MTLKICKPFALLFGNRPETWRTLSSVYCNFLLFATSVYQLWRYRRNASKKSTENATPTFCLSSATGHFALKRRIIEGNLHKRKSINFSFADNFLASPVFLSAYGNFYKVPSNWNKLKIAPLLFLPTLFSWWKKNTFFS